MCTGGLANDHNVAIIAPELFGDRYQSRFGMRRALPTQDGRGFKLRHFNPTAPHRIIRKKRERSIVNLNRADDTFCLPCFGRDGLSDKRIMT